MQRYITPPLYIVQLVLQTTHTSGLAQVSLHRKQSNLLDWALAPASMA